MLDLSSTPQLVMSALTLFVGAGGLKVLADYVRERREFHATTQGQMIEELNKLIVAERVRYTEQIEYERQRCASDMAILQNRIKVLESKVDELQGIDSRKVVSL